MTFIILYNIIILNRELRKFLPPLGDSQTMRLHIGRYNNIILCYIEFCNFHTVVRAGMFDVYFILLLLFLISFYLSFMLRAHMYMYMGVTDKNIIIYNLYNM